MVFPIPPIPEWLLPLPVPALSRCFPVFNIPAFPPLSWLVSVVPEETELFSWFPNYF